MRETSEPRAPMQAPVLIILPTLMSVGVILKVIQATHEDEERRNRDDRGGDEH